MSLKCHHYDFVIPITNINKVYKGGFEKFKEVNSHLFAEPYCLANHYDEHLVKFSAMGSSGFDYWINEWEEMGLLGVEESGECKIWKDFCVISWLQGPTFPCEWLDYNKEEHSVQLRQL